MIPLREQEASVSWGKNVDANLLLGPVANSTHQATPLREKDKMAGTTTL